MRILLPLLPLLLTACIADPRAGLDDDEDGARLDGSSTDASPTDAARPDAARPDAAPPDATPADADSGPCSPAVTTHPTDGFERHEPVVAGDQVFGHRLDPQGILRSVDLADGAPVGGPTDLLVDAEGTARLLVRPDGGDGGRLIYREGRDVVLDESLAFPDPHRPFDENPRRLVAPGRAVWIDGEDVVHWQAGRVEVVGQGTINTVSMSDGLVAWVTQPGGQVHVRLDDTPEVVGATGDGLPVMVATRDHVWWLADGRPVVWRPGDPEGRPVTDLTRCEALDAEGATALVTCRTDPGVAPSVMVVARINAQGHTTVLDRAGVIMAPRAAHGALAWARYDDPDAWCATPAEGTLRWWPAGEPAILDVAPVGSGCLCCGAFWPNLHIDLGPRLVAWSYAGTPREAPAVGVARCARTP